MLNPYFAVGLLWEKKKEGEALILKIQAYCKKEDPALQSQEFHNQE